MCIPSHLVFHPDRIKHRGHKQGLETLIDWTHLSVPESNEMIQLFCFGSLRECRQKFSWVCQSICVTYVAISVKINASNMYFFNGIEKCSFFRFCLLFDTLCPWPLSLGELTSLRSLIRIFNRLNPAFRQSMDICGQSWPRPLTSEHWVLSLTKLKEAGNLVT